MKSKNTLHPVIVLCIASCFFYSIAFSQVNRSLPPQGWQKDPFSQKVFIENKGQLDEKQNNGNGKILFSVSEQAVKMYWSAQGLTYDVAERFMSEEAKREAQREMQKGGDPDAMMGKMQVRHHYLNMEWVGSNSNAEVIPDQQVSNYFTYPNLADKSGKTGIKALAFRKIIYKNIYPGIDAEYILPEKGGIKYSFIVHPGADPNLIKIRYKGADNVNLNSNGEMEINSAQCGNYLEHRPVSNYKDGTFVNSSFSFRKGIIGFDIPVYDKTKTLIIDPWVTPVSFPSTAGPYTPYAKTGYDVAYDVNGNVWIYGGGDPLYLAKYDNTGALLWTYTNPLVNTADLMGDFDVDKISGTAYMSQGVNINTGANVVKLNSAGIQTALFGGHAMSFEIPRIRLDCSGKVYTACAGIETSGGYQVGYLDSNLTALTGIHYLPTPEGDHDPSLFTLDPSGNFIYMNFNFPASQSVFYDNTMYKVAIPVFAPAAVLNAGPIYSFKELGSLSYAGRDGWGNYWGIDEWRLNMFNGMVAGDCFLYTYNGDTLKKWDKVTGTMLAEVKTGGKRYFSGGLDMDLGENIYAGVGNKVKEYDANLTLINTYNLPDTSCYDLKVDKVRNLLYATGNGYVCAIAVTTSPAPSLTVTTSFTAATCTCDGTASINISGGCNTNPYSYVWMPGGQNSQTATGLCPGTYSVSISSSCIPFLTNTVAVPGGSVLTTTLTSTQAVCSNNGTASVNIITGTSPYTYSWNPSGQITATATGLGAGTYSVTVTDGNGCSSTSTVTITLSTALTSSVTSTAASCGGNSGTATISSASGSPPYTYSWSDGQTSQTASGLLAGDYSVTISDASGCSSTQTITVAPTGSITATATGAIMCIGQSASLTASGGTNYLWSDGSTTATINVSPTTSVTYSVIVSSGTCADTVTSTVIVTSVPVVSAYSNTTITAGGSTTLSATGGIGYTWSTGETSTIISVSPVVTTTYCVSSGSGSCADTACVTVYVEIPDDCGYADDQLFVPDAFSPNGDQKNDILGVYYPNISCIKEFIFIVYDRWGENVFEANNITALWDGTYKGKMMNTAVFVYYMKVTFITGSEVVRKGNVSLIR